MFVIKNKYTNLFIKDKFFEEDLLDNARIFYNRKNAELSLLQTSKKGYSGFDIDDYEIIEANLNIKHLSNQEIWDIAKDIVNSQKKILEVDSTKVDWNMLQELWFDYLEEKLIESVKTNK